MDNWQDRVIELERRVEVLERLLHAKSAPPGINKPTAATEKDESLSVLRVDVTSKRYDPVDTDSGKYEDHIWFNLVCMLSEGVKATRAIKGTLEFADLFGEVKFRVQYTFNDTIKPGVPHVESGIGFAYNQFLSEHQWMLTTDVDDMECNFRAKSVLYADGTNRNFA